jgi:hypothetical protein
LTCCEQSQEGFNTLTIQRNSEAQKLDSHDNSFSDTLDDIREAFKLTLAFTQGGLPAVAAEIGQNIIIDQTTDAIVDVIVGRDDNPQAELEAEQAQADAIHASVSSIRAANSGSMPIVGEDSFQARDNAIARDNQAVADVAASMGASAPVTIDSGDAAGASQLANARELATAA